MSLLTGSTNCIKYILAALNFAFLLTGIILIAVGVGVGSVYNGYELFLVNKFFSIPTFLIVIGSLILVFALIGCWGTLKENYYIILAFSVLLGLIFILELSAGISGYILRSDAEDLIRSSLNSTMKEYTKNRDVTKLWDDVQRSLTCCGIDSFKDWDSIFPNKLPLSCCEIPYGIVDPFSCTPLNEDTNRYSDGCLKTFSKLIADHATSLGAAGIVIAVIQFFGVLFSCYIAREIKIRNGITGLTG